MTYDEYAKHLGGLVADFHSLEFILRAFLQQLPLARPIGFPAGTDIYSFPLGTELPESELTSYDSLGQLIDKYNVEIAGRNTGPQIDRTLVDLRDALAHGRVSSDTPDNDDLRLLKFSRPNNGKVLITFNEALTESWFILQKKRVCEVVQSVYKNLTP